jgi:ribonuclease E
MEHETDVAVPQTRPADTNGLSERQLAFKRGAPAPRPAVEKAAPVEEPKVARAPKAAATATKPAREAAKPVREVAEPSDSPSTTGEEAPTGEGAPRRRSRGGRGRGGAGRKPAGEATVGTDNGEVTAAAPPVDGPPADEGEGAAPSDGTSGAPRKRRRRGGRGRGSGSRSGSATGALEQGEEDPHAGEASDAKAPRPKPKAKATSRPEPKTAKEAVAKTKDPKAKEPGTRAPRSRTKSMSTEEQVESGGPTRALRSTRSRTGRDGSRSRARREPFVAPPRVTDKLMVITEHGDRDQIAVLEQDVLVQHYVTRTGARSMVGNVYLSRVQNVLPGMEAAFVDIGRGRNGVLYAGEVNYSPEDLEGPAPRIEQVLKNGQAVMVQITKDPMGGKGARVTAQISLPGRYLVFAPNQSLSGISRRLPDEERKRLKSIMKKIKPDGDGVIVRTAAEGASEEALTGDLARLVRQWDDIQKQAKKVKAPDVLYEEPELTVRVVRDLFTDEEYRELVTDSPRVYEKVMAYVRDIAPDLEPKIRLHQGKLPAFEEFRVVEQIHKALDKKVWLPSGGYLFIERTEAMTIVDVNTGKSVGKTNLEETVKNTNLEAAAEVARQLRLRDIGGIIVIDFIDMLLDKNKKQVEDTMKDALAIDKTRSQVFEIGPLGLMQVTRKRVSSGLVESFSETCPTCEGRGILINYEV